MSKKSEGTKLIDDNDKSNKRLFSKCCMYPKPIYFIVVTEFCERFNFYGLRAILILYLTRHLMMHENNATAVFHMFICLSYFTSIIGGYLADSYLGKYKTILIMSLIYTTGSALLSLTAIGPANFSGPIVSLILVGFGTGGVKSCVGPFGGDQIPSNKPELIDSYFSMFYFSINAGALISTILTPILRANVQCNHADCYPLAFGIPAVLMVVATIIYFTGRKHYINVQVSQSIYNKAFKCMIYSMKKYFANRKENPEKAMLDYSLDVYEKDFVEDLKTLGRIALLYLPLPIYWSLYDQQGSRWTLQAAKLDGEIGKSITILPDQMNFVNTIMVMLLIPVFESCIYPIIQNTNQAGKPLRRMTCGLLLTALSFLVAFGLQRRIEQVGLQPIQHGMGRIRLADLTPCPLEMTLTSEDSGKNFKIFTDLGFSTSKSYMDLKQGFYQLEVKTKQNCKKIKSQKKLKTKLKIQSQHTESILISLNYLEDSRLHATLLHEKPAAHNKGHPQIRMMPIIVGKNDYKDCEKIGKMDVVLFRTKENKIKAQFPIYCNMSKLKIMKDLSLLDLDYQGHFIWLVNSEYSKRKRLGNQEKITQKASSEIPIPIYYRNSIGKWTNKPFKIRSSEVITFTGVFQNRSVVIIPIITNVGASISILWQIPQYLLISVGEVLLAITGLMFSYEQAPAGMKSLVTALWYINTALGNMIVMIVAKTTFFEKQSWEFLIFAFLGTLFTIIFGILAKYYKENTTGLLQRNYQQPIPVMLNETGDVDNSMAIANNITDETVE